MVELKVCLADQFYFPVESQYHKVFHMPVAISILIDLIFDANQDEDFTCNIILSMAEVVIFSAVICFGLHLLQDIHHLIIAKEEPIKFVGDLLLSQYQCTGKIGLNI